MPACGAPGWRPEALLPLWLASSATPTSKSVHVYHLIAADENRGHGTFFGCGVEI